MVGTGQAKGGTHIIFTGEVSRVREAFRTSQNSGSLKKIVMVISDDRLLEFKHLRNEIANYCTEFVIKSVNITDVAQCALIVYEIVTTEKKQGNLVTINITDSSVFAFTISVCIVGSITKLR